MDLNDIRKQIDDIDNEILALFCKRMDLVKGVAEYKIAHDMQVFRPERESVILDKAEKTAGEEYGRYARDLYENIMRISREMQQEIIANAAE